MRLTITDRCKIWEINDKNGYAEVKFSTSRKVDESNSYDKTQIENGVAKNGYISDYKSFVRFVGHAYNKLKEIEIGTAITNLVSDFSDEPYWDSKNGCVAYPKSTKRTVFDFEIYNPENNNYNKGNNMDKAPKVENNSNNVSAPVKQQPQEELKAADECPF